MLDGLLDLAVAGCARLTELQAQSLQPDSLPVVSTPRLVLATRNAHKVTELVRLLRPSSRTWPTTPWSVTALARFGLPDVGEVAETGVTFAENALLKARAVAAATGLPAVADDSGLCVAVLGGAPGVFSARWAGRHGDDAANLRLAARPAVRRRGPAPRGAGSSAPPRWWTPPAAASPRRWWPGG